MNEQMIGANIRRCREQTGLTLTEVAGRARLTKSALSKIERGQGSPPIATILRIADVLKTPLAELLTEPEATVPYVLTHRGEGRILTRDGSRFGYSYEALALDMRQKAMEPFLLTIRPGDPTGRFQHGGQEFIYMLSGQMEVCIDEEKLRLSAGDSLYFDPSHPHATRVLGKRPATFLCLFVQSAKNA